MRARREAPESLGESRHGVRRLGHGAAGELALLVADDHRQLLGGGERDDQRGITQVLSG
ncbi:hypothetical protein [Streptomyces venetus]|uniref:hypothetical protein n=1 Tax=Streptomyces venetus TaxID=1701086 RepID=UPI0031EF076D